MERSTDFSPSTPSTTPAPEAEDKLAVFCPENGKYSACIYYRVEVPFRGLQKFCAAETLIANTTDFVPDTRNAMMCSSDITLFFAKGGEAVNSTIGSLRQMRPGQDEKGKTIYPPSVIFDIDDNIDWVHPFNSSFAYMGTRDYGGNLLKPGDSLKTTFPDGQEVTVWADKMTTFDDNLFDIERNHATIAGVHRTAKLVDGVTAPSPYLADYYREIHGCENVYVFPNSVIPEDYPKARLAPRGDGSVRIIWQGGGSHMIDWFPLRDAVREISLKYPFVKWVIWGSPFRWIHDNIPESQLELGNWIDYHAYKAHRVLVDADINLCPLVDNEFNRSKSAIKWYEGSMLHRPEATLAGNCRPYSEEMVDGETGLLYNDPQDFSEKLSKLIEDAELRTRLGENAKKWILENRHYEKTVPKLFEFYQGLRATKRKVYEA